MKQKWTYYAELATRGYVFLIMNVYGWSKIAGGQFYRKGHLPPAIASQTLEQVSAFDLGWTFMGYSYAYILFIGACQVAGAFLLVINRTKLLGATLLFPVLLNIVVYDLIFMDKFGALLTAYVTLLLLVWMMWMNRETIISAVKVLMKKNMDPVKPGWKRRLMVAMVTCVLVAVIFIAELVVRNLIPV